MIRSDDLLAKHSELVRWFYEGSEYGAPPECGGENFHGCSHSMRVLVLALTICTFSNYTERIMTQVALAAAAHDIGRTHQGVDDEHGEKSVVLLQSLADELKQQWGVEVTQPVLYAIRYHSLDDSEAMFEGFANAREAAEARTVYAVLKDADALDRVRLGDLDTRFLRLPASPNLVSLAELLLEGAELIAPSFPQWSPA